MKKSRKVLSVLLSLLLVVTSIPFVVVATAEEGYEVSASDSGSVELKGTALKWTQKLTYAGEGLFNLNLTATANSNTMFESAVRSKVENNYFTAKNAGYYLVELWGGAGAEGETTANSGSQGGNGGDAGYVYGYVYLNEGDILYSSIGGQGKQVAKSDPGESAANEGGVHGDTGSYKVGGGGGYSALYLFHADEKDSFESKYVNADGTMNPINEEDRTTRYIMIAGGGGGVRAVVYAAHDEVGLPVGEDLVDGELDAACRSAVEVDPADSVLSSQLADSHGLETHSESDGY